MTFDLNSPDLPRFGVGAPARRIEDKALITGAGRFTDDISPPGTLHAFLLRSAMGHADISVGDLAAIRTMPGVRLVWTEADLAGVGGLPASTKPMLLDGSAMPVPERPLLARRRVRHIGEPIVLVVADSLHQARNAAEAIEVAYEPLDAVVDTEGALAADSAIVWPERGGNTAYEVHLGEKEATDAAFAKAARVSRIKVVNNRLVANYMEPRACLAEFDTLSGRYTLTMGTQGGHAMRRIIAKNILKIDEADLRVITPDVGGGFGARIFVYHEYPLMALAAKALGKPVKWTGDRTEHFLSDAQGRDHVSVAEMAMDAHGKFLALRIDLISNLGAYVSQFGAGLGTGSTRMATGVYDIPLLFARSRGVYTNTVPTDAYRGAGRPEAAYLIDRLVETCGRDTGLGPAEIRRRNFIKPEQMPYKAPTGREYDSGAFATHMQAALDNADFAGLPARRAEARSRGMIRGFGFACYIEACAFPGDEPATVRLDKDGGVTMFVGTQSNGQGHATAYAQFVVGHLGIGYDKVRLVQGDTDQVKQGGGTGGSRSIPIGAVSVDRAGAALAVKLKALAAEVLEASAADLELVDGAVRIAGTDRSVSLAELAAKAADPEAVTAMENYRQPVSTFPNGTHACEVEIDPETGETRIVGYTVVDDFGVVVNPLLLAGQVQGGVAQGVGQALKERTVYDGSGQLVSATFLDYAMPLAEDVPFISFDTRNVPCKNNPLGIKGAGEAGTVGACAAVMNAIADALAEPFGITHVDMPATPALLWAAIQARAQGRQQA